MSWKTFKMHQKDALMLRSRILGFILKQIKSLLHIFSDFTIPHALCIEIIWEGRQIHVFVHDSWYLITKADGISLLLVRFILKSVSQVRKISTRWIPHALTDNQNLVRVQTAISCNSPKCFQPQSKTWVHYFEPVRKKIINMVNQTRTISKKISLHSLQFITYFLHVMV